MGGGIVGLLDRFRNANPVSAATSGVVQGTLSAIGQTAIDIRTAITGEAPLDPEKRAEIEAKLAEIEQAAQQGQVDINKIEAASSRLFISGWRPFLGWTGGLAIAYNFIARPLLVAFGVEAPAVDTAALWPVILGMLGLGAYRTVEKSNGSVGLH